LLRLALSVTLLFVACGGRPTDLTDSGAGDSVPESDGAVVVLDGGSADTVVIDTSVPGCATKKDCSPTDYCALDNVCVVTGAKMGECKPRPQGCPDLAAPVCGCDGKDYGNSCEAAAAGVNVAHDGACDNKCGNLLYLPACKPGDVCDYKTCTAVEGSCVKQPSKIDCLAISAIIPVCGCDGKTYEHECWRLAAGVAQAHAGACAPSGKVMIVTDKSSYGAGDKIKATLTNGTGSSVYVDNCWAFNREHQESGAWISKGPDVVCGTGGMAQELKAGQALTRTTMLAGGLWRLAMDVGTGCTPGGPFSAQHCATMTTYRSAPFTVQPTSKQCLDLDAKYLATLPSALKCTGALSVPQCDKPRADALHCPCYGFVEQTAALDAIKQQWDDAFCAKANLPPCVPKPCPKPGPLQCINDLCQ